MVKVIAVLATGPNNEIGLNGKLPWRCKEDLKHFKEITANKVCIVGWKTKQSLPPLPGRIVLIDPIGTDPREFIEFIGKTHNVDEVAIIGGGKTYDRYANIIDEWHLSHIRGFEGEADAFYSIPNEYEKTIHHYVFEVDKLNATLESSREALMESVKS